MSHTRYRHIFSSLFVIVVYALLAATLPMGCSSEKTSPTLPGAHPVSWMQSESPDFHGRLVYQNGTESCASCHGINQTGGRVEISCLDCHGPGGADCSRCHGGEDNSTGAPPTGLRGESADTSLAVGAHTAHLVNSWLATAVPCSTCHTVPLYLLSPGHVDQPGTGGQPPDSIAEIVWHGLADPGNAAWDRVTRTCAGTYCHGNFSGGYANNAPVWTGSNQATCGSCHDVGRDPGQLGGSHAYHVNTAGLACGDCHFSVTDTLLNILNPALHVNGQADFLVRDQALCDDCHGSGPEVCIQCHGGTDNQTGAPPLGLEGETATGQLAVGAHTTHLEGDTQADAFACSECHVVPAAMIAPGHLDPDETAELTWGPLAGPASSWIRGSASCTNTYCHGNFTGGETANAPVWTGVNQATCGSCHDVGSDPDRLLWIHPYHINTAGLTCGDCHASVVDTLLNIVNTALHVNGQVEILTRDPALCDDCHGTGPEVCIQCHGGTDNLTGAPPVGLEGETLFSQLAVGAHTAHMEGGAQADAFACSDCHRVPSTLLTIGHLGVDEIAEITWSPLAGSSASWSRGSARCSNTYCHGNFAGGYATNNPLWTGTNQAACGSCHNVGSDLEDLSGEHKKHVVDEGLDCEECHETVVNASMVIIDPALHVNGTKNVSLLRGGRFQNGGCTGLNGATCHGAETWD